MPDSHFRFTPKGGAQADWRRPHPHRECKAGMVIPLPIMTNRRQLFATVTAHG